MDAGGGATGGASGNGGSAGGGATGGTSGQGATGGASGHGGSASGGATGGTGDCAWVDARPVLRDPAIWFVFDQSMLYLNFVTPSGQAAGINLVLLRQLLVEDGGVVPRLQHWVRFGLAAHGDSGGDPCLDGITVPPMLQNLPAIEDALDGYLADFQGNGGASWESMAVIAEHIRHQAPPLRNAVVLIKAPIEYATCSTLLAPVHPHELVPAGVRELVDLGATVSVVTVPATALNSGAHHEMINESARVRHAELAVLGGGEAVFADDRQAFEDAVNRFVDASVTCTVVLDGEVTDGGDCDGEVRLGDQALTCNHADGYHLIDRSTLEITGAACDRLKSESDLSIQARFPCHSFMGPD